MMKTRWSVLLALTIALSACTPKEEATHDATETEAIATQVDAERENDALTEETTEEKADKEEVQREENLLTATETARPRDEIAHEAAWHGTMTIDGKTIDIWLTGLTTETIDVPSGFGQEGDLAVHGNAHIFAADEQSDTAYLYDTIDVSQVNVTNEHIRMETLLDRPTLIIEEWQSFNTNVATLFIYEDGAIHRLNDEPFISTGTIKAIAPHFYETVTWMTGEEFPNMNVFTIDARTGKVVTTVPFVYDAELVYEAWHEHESLHFPVPQYKWDDTWWPYIVEHRRFPHAETPIAIGDSLDAIREQHDGSQRWEVDHYGKISYRTNDGLDVAGQGIATQLETTVDSFYDTTVSTLVQSIERATGATFDYVEGSDEYPPHYSVELDEWYVTIIALSDTKWGLELLHIPTYNGQ